MRRYVALGCLIALLGAVTACGFARWPLNAARVGASLNAAFGASPRLHWSAPQAASFSALPWPRLRVAEARLDDDYGVNLMSAPYARFDLSLIELIRGRFIPVSATLGRPVVTLDLDRPPFAGAAGEPAQPASVAAALAPLKSLSLRNGALRLTSGSRGFDTLIANVRGRVDGLEIGNQLRFNLSADWRNERIAIVGALGDPEAAAKGAPSPFQLALDSPIAKLVFGGALAGGDRPSAEGDLTVSVPSLAALTHLFGMAPPSFLASDDVWVTADVKASPGALSLRDAKFASAGQTLEGALEVVDSGGPPAVSGTLAADALALAPLFGPTERLFDPSGRWSAAPFTFQPPRDLNVDLRLSAARLDVYGRGLSNVAASLIVKDGKLSATLIDAAAYEGRVEGEASVDRVGDEFRTRVRADAQGFDLGLALADFARPVASGRADARLSIETAGASPAAAVANLSGSASLEAADGEIIGVNLEEALRRSQRRPIDVARDMRLGGTAFDKLSVSLALNGGRALVERGELTSRGVAAGFGGAIDLPACAWDLRLNAVQTDGAGEESPDAAHLVLDIDGPWAAPRIRALGDGGAPRTDGGQAAAP